jgi:hypothetical protein
MGTDVEAHRAGREKGCVKSLEPSGPQGVAIVQAQGAGEAEGACDTVGAGHGCRSGYDLSLFGNLVFKLLLLHSMMIIMIVVGELHACLQSQ